MHLGQNTGGIGARSELRAFNLSTFNYDSLNRLTSVIQLGSMTEFREFRGHLT